MLYASKDGSWEREEAVARILKGLIAKNIGGGGRGGWVEDSKNLAAKSLYNFLYHIERATPSNQCILFYLHGKNNNDNNNFSFFNNILPYNIFLLVATFFFTKKLWMTSINSLHKWVEVE